HPNHHSFPTRRSSDLEHPHSACNGPRQGALCSRLVISRQGRHTLRETTFATLEHQALRVRGLYRRTDRRISSGHSLPGSHRSPRSEEHTSELQSRENI